MKSTRAGVLSLAILGSLSLAAVGTAQVSPSPALLVGEKSAGLVAVVDPATLRVLAHIPANPNVHEIATDGRRAYVSNSGRRSITVIDLASRTQAAPIELGALGPIHGLWVNGGKLFFASEPAQIIGRYDPATSQIDWVLGTGYRSHMLVLSPDGEKIYTTNGTSGSVSIIERPARPGGGAPGNWAVTALPAGRGVEGLDLSPDGRELWAINVQDKTITVVDVVNRSVVATIPVVSTYSNRVKLTPDGKYALVSDFRGTHLMVFDVATRREIKRINVGGGAEGVLVEPGGARAFVAVSALNRMAVVDLASLEITSVIEGLQNPDGMAWAVAPR